MSATIIILAGLMGAAGVVLLAASAHAAPGAGLDSAGQVLLFHAAAAIAAIAAIQQGLVTRPLAFIAVIGMVVGAVMFSGDIAMRAFLNQRLFPMAAPTGGFVLIGSWLALSAAALVTVIRAN